MATNTSIINKAGEDYNTLTLWEDDVDGDLVTGTRVEIAECYNDDGALSDSLIIDGSTTNATYYLKVTVPSGERHNGTAYALDTGAGTPFRVESSAIAGLQVKDDYCIVEWICFKGYTTGDYITAYGFVVDSTGAVIRRSIIYEWSNSGGYGSCYAAAIFVGYFVNNILHPDFSRLGDRIMLLAGNSSARVWNNSCYDNTGTMKRGILIQDYQAPHVKNCVCIGSADDYFKSTYGNETNVDYIATGDASPAGANSIGSLTASDEFTTLTDDAEDLHLKSTSNIIDEGVDLGTGYEVEIDINGRNRDTEGDTWDIGADEYVSSAPAATIKRRMLMGVGF